MWKEGWLLKEAGEAASGRQRWVDRMKHVLLGDDTALF